MDRIDRGTSIFYADDGLLAGNNPTKLQRSLNIIEKGFNSLGLKANARKTEFLIAKSNSGRGRLSTNAYQRRVTGEGVSYRENELQ